MAENAYNSASSPAPAPLAGTQISLDAAVPLPLHLPSPELEFYRSYEWTLNLYPTVGEVQVHLAEECRRLGEVRGDWQRQEIATNIFLLACAISNAVDDFLLGARWDFSKPAAQVPRLRGVARFVEKLLSVPWKLREAWLTSLHCWNEQCREGIVAFLQATFVGGNVADVPAEAAQALLGLFARDFPSRLQEVRARVPGAFRSQSLAPADVVSLAQKFVVAYPDRRRAVWVFGLRTTGSYFAPLVCAHLRSCGYVSVQMGTLRPKNGLTHWEAQKFTGCASKGDLAVLVDEPVTTGRTLELATEMLRQAGIPFENIVALYPLHPTRHPTQNGATEHQSPIARIILPCEEWEKTRRMEPQAAGALIREYFLERGYSEAQLSAGPGLKVQCDRLNALTVKKGHIHFKRLYQCRLTRPSGQEETRYVLAKSVGWGWLSYHAFLIADRMSAHLPPVLGLREGILFSEWLPEAPLAEPESPCREIAVRRLADYAATRTRLLSFGKTPLPDLNQERDHRGMDLLVSALGQAYRGRVTAALRRPRLREKLARLADSPPVLIDGRMRPVEWIPTPSGLLKTDFAHHGLGKTELNVTDPAYDLADAILHWNLSPAEEHTLLAEYTKRSGDAVAAGRLFLYELIAGLWAAVYAREHFESPHLAPRYAEFNQDYLNARRFLTVQTIRHCGPFCRKPEKLSWRAPLVVLDLDGVLDDWLFGFPAPTAAGLRALALLHTHGFTLAVNTGRPLCEVKEYCRGYGFAGGVAEFGSALWDEVRQRESVLISQASLAELELARAALRKVPGVYLNDNYRYSVRVHSFEKDEPVSVPVAEVRGLLAKLGLTGLCVLQGNTETAIIACEVDKGVGLRALLEAAGIPAQETTAVGDSQADLAMFRVAGRSFAPAQISCRAEAEALGCWIVKRAHQAGLLEIARSLVHPQGGSCDRCRTTERLWPDRKDLFLELIEQADREGVLPLVGALLDPLAWRAFRK